MLRPPPKRGRLPKGSGPQREDAPCGPFRRVTPANLKLAGEPNERGWCCRAERPREKT